MDGQSIWLCSKEKRGVQIERGECFVTFTWWSWENDSQAAQSGNLTHWCLASIDMANSRKAVKRIRIIMEEFGNTQIRTSSSCSSERKKDINNLFWGSEYFVFGQILGL